MAAATGRQLVFVSVPFAPDWRTGAETVKHSAARAEQLTRALGREFEVRGPFFRGTKFSLVQLGAGASTLSLDQLYGLLEALYNNLTVEPTEQALAVLPNTFDGGKAKVLHESGFDRVALCTDDPDRTRNDYRMLRDAGFPSVGVELPLLREPRDWERRLDALLGLDPDHITCYLDGGYDKLSLLNVLRRTRDRFDGRYAEWAPLAFFRPGKEPARWDGVAGFGPGALSTAKGEATRNRPDFGGYAKAAAAGEAVTAQADRVALAALALSGPDGFAWSAGAVERGLVARGLLERRGDRLHLTDQGLVARDRVIAELGQAG